MAFLWQLAYEGGGNHLPTISPSEVVGWCGGYKKSGCMAGSCFGQKLFLMLANRAVKPPTGHQPRGVDQTFTECASQLRRGTQKIVEDTQVMHTIENRIDFLISWPL